MIGYQQELCNVLRLALHAFWLQSHGDSLGSASGGNWKAATLTNQGVTLMCKSRHFVATLDARDVSPAKLQESQQIHDLYSSLAGEKCLQRTRSPTASTWNSCGRL